MKKINWLKETPFILVFALPWIILAALGNSLPAQVPSHYSITGNGWVADDYMSPVSFIAVLTIGMAIVYISMSLSQRIYYFKLALILFFDAIAVGTLLSPEVMKSSAFMVILLAIVNGLIYFIFSRTQMKPLSDKHFNIIWVGTHFITTLPLLLLLFSAQDWVIRRIIPEAFFLFMAVIGNLTKNIKPNFFIGIRTPWTLMDEDVWRRTHRDTAKWLFAGALLGFVICIFAPLSWLHLLVMIFSLGYTAYCIGYSYFIYKQQNPHLP